MLSLKTNQVSYKLNEGYSYKAENGSIMDYILLRYIIKPLLKYLPYSIPANIITIFSNFCAFLSFFVVMQSTNGNFKMWFAIPVLIFLYVLGDCTDGEQARRTHTGSRLGEFLDHFLDSFVSGELVISLLIVYNISNPFIAGFALMATYFTQSAAFWERYKTGSMHFGRFSSTESILVLTILITIGGIAPVRNLATSQFIADTGIFTKLFATLTYADFIMILLAIGAIISMLASVLRSKGISIRFGSFIFLSMIVTAVFVTKYTTNPILAYFTISLFNVSYIASLLYSIVMKENDSYPDFVMLFFVLVLTALRIPGDIILKVSFSYVLMEVIIRASILISKNKQYWVWVNPNPNE